MTTGRWPLVEFDRPPVGEVTLSVQFEPLAAMTAVDIGRLWTAWRKDYPDYESRDPLRPFVTDDSGRYFVDYYEEAPLPRTWFKDQNFEHVLQIQRDRISHNWRRPDGGGYPHYSELRPRFERELVRFSRYTRRNGLGVIAPTACQVTYTNPVALSDCPSGLKGLLRAWNLPKPQQLPLGAPEAHIGLRFGIDGGAGRAGYLYVAAWEGVEDTEEPILLLELTARGAPTAASIEAALAFCDIGHDAIVSTFDAVTTPQMHQKWGKR